MEFTRITPVIEANRTTLLLCMYSELCGCTRTRGYDGRVLILRVGYGYDAKVTGTGGYTRMFRGI